MIIFHLEATPRKSADNLRERAAAVCRREALGLLRRDRRKYARIVTALYLGHWRVERWRLRVLRACYFYFRLLDDLADGDREGPIPADALLDEQSARWLSAIGEPRDGEANLLFENLWLELGRTPLPGAKLRATGAALLEGLRWDLHRRGERYVPSGCELENYYAQVILAPAQLALTILGEGGEPAGLRELAQLIGRLQSVRDLAADSRAGVVNIPREAAVGTRLEDARAWSECEVAHCLPRLNAWWTAGRAGADWRTRLVLGSAVKTLRQWARTRFGSDR